MHSAGLELTKLTYTKLGDNLIRHRGDRQATIPPLRPHAWIYGVHPLYMSDVEVELISSVICVLPPFHHKKAIMNQ